MEPSELESTNCSARKNKKKKEKSIEEGKHLKNKNPKNTKSSRDKNFAWNNVGLQLSAV